MQDRRQDHTQPNTIHEVPNFTLERGPKSSGSASDSPAPTALSFRLIADFSVDANTAEAFLADRDLTPEERSFFLTMLNDPEAFNRMCRLAIVSDLGVYGGKYFEGEIEAPDADDILACASPYLSTEQREYWNRLWQTQPERVTSFLLDAFMEFRSVLQRAVVQDLTTGAMIPMRVNRSRRAERAAAEELSACDQELGF